MKNKFIQYAIGVVIAASALTSCEVSSFGVSVQPTRPVYVRPNSPGPGYVWVEGDWIYTNGNYNWHEGYWSAPRRGRTWVAGSWEQGRRGYVWRKGHWR